MSETVNEPRNLIGVSLDMDLLLRALRRGVAEFYPPTGELRFNGLMYSTRVGDWSQLLDVIGREKLAAAIWKAEGR